MAWSDDAQSVLDYVHKVTWMMDCLLESLKVTIYITIDREVMTLTVVLTHNRET